jgi:DNA-binding transcriptional ArsR family regulator
MIAAPPKHREKATLEVTGADGQPIIIPEKQWYVTPKARPQRMMRNSLSNEARQVYACLELATMGWRQELAVKMDNGKTVPLTASDLVEQTGLSLPNVRRALIELEEEGLGCRRSADDGPLRKGKVEIYSFAVPRPAQKVKYQSRATGILELDDAELKPLQTFLKRWKITPDPEIPVARDGLKSLSDDIAQWEKTGNALRARAETLCAPSRYKEERKERNGKEYIGERPPSSSAVPTLEEDPPKKAEEEEDRSPYQKFKAAYPPDHFDEPKAKPSFEKKTKTEQAGILARLQVYLSCDRWQDDGGRWIPFASKWLESYEADPPPALKKAKTATTTGIDEERLRRIAAQVEEDRKWR